METCLVLSARRYSFKDDNGQQIDGVTVTYLTDDNQDEGNTRGCIPLSITAPLALWEAIPPLPAFCDMEFRQRPGPKGKPTLTLTQVRYLSDGSFQFPSEAASGGA
jgi:hypothetical protein